MWRETYIIFMNMKWCMWVLDTLSNSLLNKFTLLIERPHILGVSGIEVKIKSIPKCLQSLFWNSTHQGTLLFSYSKIHKHMLSITNEVDSLFFHYAHAYFHHKSHSVLIRLHFCLTGTMWAWVSIWCWVILGLIPSISS